MPRFAFGKRKSTAEGDNDVAPPSFRVLDRSEVNDVNTGNAKNFDGGARLSAKQGLPRTTVSDLSYDDDIFADFKPNTTNRGSGSSNTTKTNSTDNSSRHSNASTTPSSADLSGHEDWKLNKKSHTEALATQTPRPTSFLRSGRSWSFGGSKKHLPPTPVGEEDVPDTPEVPQQYKAGRARATTASTDATITPNNADQDPDLGLDLGGSFSKMLLGLDKRNSAATMRDETGRHVLQPSAMTGGRVNAPSPIRVDRSSNVEPPQHSWTSHRSNDDLLGANENAPPPVPKHNQAPVRPRAPNAATSDSILKRTSAIFSGRRKSVMAIDNEGDDLDSSLLAVSRFMSDENSRSATPIEAIGGRQHKTDDAGPGYTVVPRKSPPTKDESDDDELFDNIPLNSERLVTPRQPQRRAPAAPTQAKVMTPLEFEKYRKDKEVESRRAAVDRIRDNVQDDEDEDEDDDNYDDYDDEAEKSRQLAKQRRKQEAHMSVYRQQMMKVTGDNEPRPSMVSSFSTPNLTVPDFSRNTSSTTSDAEDDEEVPLAILAAHGFPNKNRPPARLNNMMSNPNLRQAAQPSYQRPGSAQGQMPSGGGPLPPFARGLPTDPYGLVNPTVRESFHLGGGMPAGQSGMAAGQNPPASPAGPPTNHVGLVGVIASEERARSQRRGSPQVHTAEGFPGQAAMGPGGFDPNYGYPQQMMYPQGVQLQMQQMQALQMQQSMMSPGEQAQLQLSQQMSQFMQMQMQMMQMMAANSSTGAGLEPPRSAGHMSSQSLGQFEGMNGNAGMGINGPRASFLELPTMDARGDGRTMSLVQPSSSSWLQPPAGPGAGYAGSIRGGQGYAPSIAPSERSNVGLPGRYRPVSSVPPPASTTPDQTRKSYMTSALSPLGGSKTPRAGDKSLGQKVSTKEETDEDDDEGWAAMKAKREQKKSSWRIRKTVAPGDLDIGSLIT